VLILSNMRFAFWEAALLFVLWFAQFLNPALRDEISWIYAIWAGVLVVDSIADPTRWRAQQLFVELIKGQSADRKKKPERSRSTPASRS